MPRRLLKKILPQPHTLADRWFMRPFGPTLKDPVYWVPHRRGVVRAFGIGLFINFIPLPIHLVLAPLVAIALRLNIPVTIVSVFLVNPLTALPTFLTAYWMGCRLLGMELASLDFALNWEWFTAHFVGIWKPFLLGCLVLGAMTALTGYLLLSLVWRLRVSYRYQSRPWKLRRRKPAAPPADSGRDQDPTL